ncbi:MAG: riboflavin synthase [Sulfurospirillaceae bacterium]|nr:riboflavin synthase [Sulfurospirillaceae bacterium]
MFTGLIREFAYVVSYKDNVLSLKAKYKPKIGDSVAVNGACLTVVRVGEGTFDVELSAETRALVAIENYKNRVHIEPAMSLGDRLEGHIVQGHVDCLAKIKQISQQENGVDFTLVFPLEFAKFIAPKGSIAVDGVSLTVNDVSKNECRLTIIPHTLKNTLFGEYKVGARVNIETDMFARYLYHMFQKPHDVGWNTVDGIMARY